MSLYMFQYSLLCFSLYTGGPNLKHKKMSNLNTNNNNSDYDVYTKENGWNLQPSEMSQNVVNPIRRIVDGMKIEPNPEKELIRLTIGE